MRSVVFITIGANIVSILHDVGFLHQSKHSLVTSTLALVMGVAYVMMWKE